MSTEVRAAALFASMLLTATGCTTDTPGVSLPAPPPPATSHPAAPSPHPPIPSPKAVLQNSFDELAQTVAASIGIAFVPVGSTAVTAFGSWSTGVAWSTMKVPLAIAALRADPSAADAPAVQAITASDNSAAEALWSQLGPPEQAAQRVQAVLVEAGDSATVVESRRLRAGFTAFGQTQWPLDRQALFAAHLPCLTDAGARRVVDLMRDVTGGQRWGLFADGVAAKGGWGPGDGGGYLVRQFGVIPTPAGDLAVAMAAEPDAGTFGAGVEALNRMTDWLHQHAADLPGGRCPA